LDGFEFCLIPKFWTCCSTYNINFHEVSAAHGLGHSTTAQAGKQQSHTTSLAETCLCARFIAHNGKPVQVPLQEVKKANFRVTVPLQEVKKANFRVTVTVPLQEVKKANFRVTVPLQEVKKANFRVTVPLQEVQKANFRVTVTVPLQEVKKADFRVTVPLQEVKKGKLPSYIYSTVPLST